MPRSILGIHYLVLLGSTGYQCPPLKYYFRRWQRFWTLLGLVPSGLSQIIPTSYEYYPNIWFQGVQNTNFHITYHANNNNSLVIKLFNDGKCQFLKVFLSGCQAFVNFDEGLCFISYKIFHIIFCFIEDHFWLNTGTFVTWQRLPSCGLRFIDVRVYFFIRIRS